MESVDQVGFGVCLAIILPMSLAMTVRTWIRRRTWVHTEGKVVSVKTKRQTSGNAQTTVRYRYVDSLGVPQSGTDTPWFREPKRNSRISVMYDPERPEISEPSSMTWLYVLLTFSLFLFVIGAVLVVSGLS